MAAERPITPDPEHAQHALDATEDAVDEAMKEIDLDQADPSQELYDIDHERAVVEAAHQIVDDVYSPEKLAEAVDARGIIRRPSKFVPRKREEPSAEELEKGDWV